MDRVLLVEHDYINNIALHDFLRDAGFDVEAAYCGFGAVAAIERRPPRWIVTSLNLGPGPDGVEVARRARACRSDVKVVFASGALLQAIEGLGAAEFVCKPFRGQEVVDALLRTASGAVT